MKAAQYSTYGGPEVIEITDASEPTPKEKQVVVEIKAVALNPFDAKLRSGAFKDDIHLSFPFTVGADFSGVIMKVSDGVDAFKIGDEVYGSASALGDSSGAAAEYAAVNTGNIAAKPQNVTFQEAAAVVLVGVSVVQVFDQLKLSEGKKVLIHGGAGGIGSTAIQYAKHLGVHVATTAQAKDKEFVTRLGADEVIDYESQQFEEVLSNFDAVFDTVGNDTYTRSFKILRPGGIIVSMLMQPDKALAQEAGVTALYQHTKVTTESLATLRTLVESGAIKPQIDREFPLEQTAAAFAHLETGRPQGKVVLVT